MICKHDKQACIHCRIYIYTESILQFIRHDDCNLPLVDWFTMIYDKLRLYDENFQIFKLS